MIDDIIIEIMGDIQFKINKKWENPENFRKLFKYINFDTLEIPVISLEKELRLYNLLGRRERAKMIDEFMRKEKAKKEVWNLIKKMNRLWVQENKPLELKKYFHKDIVVITPVDKYILEGSETCVAGWERFVKMTKIHSWQELDPKVHIYNDGNAAVVTYYFNISYEMNGQSIKSEGRDMFFLIKENNKWMVVADQYSEFPK
jgi:ketosteroid isomerase-like protein